MQNFKVSFHTSA